MKTVSFQETGPILLVWGSALLMWVVALVPAGEASQTNGATECDCACVAPASMATETE